MASAKVYQHLPHAFNQPRPPDPLKDKIGFTCTSVTRMPYLREKLFPLLLASFRAPYSTRQYRKNPFAVSARLLILSLRDES